MKAYISILLIITFYNAYGQVYKSKLNCTGDILDVGIAIKGFAPCSQCEIKIDSLKNGFTIVLADTSYKIVAFRIDYSNTNRLLLEKDIWGNKVNKKNVDFLSKMKVGDFISIECINIKKEDYTYLSTSMLIAVD